MTEEIKQIVITEFKRLLSKAEVVDLPMQAKIQAAQGIGRLLLKLETGVPLSEDDRYKMLKSFTYAAEQMERDLDLINNLITMADAFATLVDENTPSSDELEIISQRKEAIGHRDEVRDILERYKLIIINI
jgi:hypothetical protein